jgi:hypothetical protein
MANFEHKHKKVEASMLPLSFGELNIKFEKL